MVTQTTREDGAKVFANLTQNAGSLVAKGVLNAFAQKYIEKYKEFLDKQGTDTAKIASLYATSKEEKDKACKEIGNGYNKEIEDDRRWELISAVVSTDGKKCTIEWKECVKTNVCDSLQDYVTGAQNNNCWQFRCYGAATKDFDI